jgi:2-iminobutanoate/2-iminopropanoate deaminase
MKLIHTILAPKAIGPYSQAILHNGTVYTSGQIALCPDTGELIGNDVKTQTEQCLKNLNAILREAGAGIHTILKTVIYLKSMDDFVLVNKIYESWMRDHRPARSTIAVSELPRNALIEIECIAAVIG